MVDTPYRELIFVIRAPRIRGIALAVFNGEAVFNQMLLWPIQANAENTRVHNLVHALVELEQDRVQVERSSDLLADITQQFNAVLLCGDFDGLSTNLPGAVVHSGFKRFCLSFERLRLLTGLFTLMPDDETPGSESQQQK